MKTSVYLQLALALSLSWAFNSSLSLHAQEATPPPIEATSDSIQLDHNTIGVLRIDLSKINLPAINGWVETLQAAQLYEAQLDQNVALVANFVSALEQSGTDEVYITLSINEMLRGMPVVMASTDNPTVLKGLLSMLWTETFAETPSKLSIDGSRAIFGSVASVDRLLNATKIGNDRFEVILGSHELEHQLMLSLPPESKADLVAVWPYESPASFPVRFSPSQLAADIDSIHLEWSLPPEPRVICRIESIDPEAAKRIEGIIQQVLALDSSNTQWVSVQVDQAVVRLESDPQSTAVKLTNVLNQLNESAVQRRKMNNLKLIGLAMHNHASAYKALPDAAIVDEEGQELLSWRVKILPFVEHNDLWRIIDPTKKWDDPTNHPANRVGVSPYTSVVSAMTTARIPVIQGTLWGDVTTPKVFRQILDGTSNTIMLADAPDDQAVPWGKPGLWMLDESDLMGSFFGNRDSVLVCMFDGAVMRLQRSEMTEEKLRAMLTINGKEPVPW